jgi:hypothetical protein
MHLGVARRVRWVMGRVISRTREIRGLGMGKEFCEKGVTNRERDRGFQAEKGLKKGELRGKSGIYGYSMG